MSRLIDLCKNSLKINQMKDSTAIIKPAPDTIPKPATDTIPKPDVIKPATDTILMPVVIKPAIDTIPKPAVIKPAIDTIPKPAVLKPATDTIPKPAVIKPALDTILMPVVIKPAIDTIPKPVVIKSALDTIPKPAVIKQKLEVKVNVDVFMKVKKYNTPNILLELLNKDNKSDDNMNYYMSPEYKIQLIEEWINKNKDKWYNTGITTSDIKDFHKDHKYALTSEQIFSYLFNNNLPVILGNTAKFILSYFNSTNINNIEESNIKLSKDTIVTYCKQLNIYYSIIKDWIESLPYKAPTTSDISNFKEKNPIFIDNQIVEGILINDFNIKVPRKIEGITIIRKPKDEYTLQIYKINRFVQKYYRYYTDITYNLLIGELYKAYPQNVDGLLFYNIIREENEHILQTGGKSIECNNTQVLYNTLGSCWNNSIQSIYAFYLDSFDSILDKTGTDLYKEAEINQLINYLPIRFIERKKLIIEMLDSMIKRWKNKREKTKGITIYSEEDSECEVKNLGIFMKELMSSTKLIDKQITKEDLIDNVGGNLVHYFFMHLIINVFICKEIYDFTFYMHQGTINYTNELKLAKLFRGKPYLQLINSEFIKDSLNDDNLVGISFQLYKHATCIVKCSGSKYGNFNNYYDDNHQKIYTINYEEFRQTLINAKDLLSKPNIKLEIIKPNGEDVKVVLIDDNTGKIINRQTDSMKQKYLKYKQKYLQYKNSISYTYEDLK